MALLYLLSPAVRILVVMIEGFSSSNLTAEMNVELLQSKRIKANLI